MQGEVYTYYLVTYYHCNGVVHAERYTIVVSRDRVYSLKTSSLPESWSA
jgi:hypothetical protein